MKSAELIFTLIAGVIAVFLFTLYIVADAIAWVFERIAAGCHWAAIWIMELDER